MMCVLPQIGGSNFFLGRNKTEGNEIGCRNVDTHRHVHACAHTLMRRTCSNGYLAAAETLEHVIWGGYD